MTSKITKILIKIIALSGMIIAGYLIYSMFPVIKNKINPNGLNYCMKDSDCEFFGNIDDCNAGCYNKSFMPSIHKKGCPASMPVDCGCSNGKCNYQPKPIGTFDECSQLGYPVLDTYPKQCKFFDKIFIESTCTKDGTDYMMSLSEAKEIAMKSECGDNLKDIAVCNHVTGTYWIDLDSEKKGCFPACVIDVQNKTASINWRCTGLIK